MKIIKESNPMNTIHSTQGFTIDLNSGLSVVATAYINAEILNTRGKIAEFEVCDVETEFYIGGKKCKYVGFKELYTKLFGENSMKQLEDDVHGFVTKRVLENSYIMGYQSVDSLPANAIMDLIMKEVQEQFVVWGGLLYTSNFRVMRLVKLYNEKSAGTHYIDTYAAYDVPPSYQVKKGEHMDAIGKSRNYKVNYIKLEVVERIDGKITSVQPIVR